MIRLAWGGLYTIEAMGAALQIVRAVEIAANRVKSCTRSILDCRLSKLNDYSVLHLAFYSQSA